MSTLFAAAPWLTLVTGHYGVGKTNLSLNLARSLRTVASRVTLIDLDIVNPYFRSTDNRAFTEKFDIELFGPTYGASNLDTPSLSPAIDPAIQSATRCSSDVQPDNKPALGDACRADTGTDTGLGVCTDACSDACPDAQQSIHAVLLDVGGDPDGARALGRYAARIAARPHRMVYVANFNRPETATVAENSALLTKIEESCKLKVTDLVGNTHLKEFTTAEDIAASAVPLHELARATGLPLRAITAPRALAAEVAALVGDVEVYPVDLIVGTPWEGGE